MREQSTRFQVERRPIPVPCRKCRYGLTQDANGDWYDPSGSYFCDGDPDLGRHVPSTDDDDAEIDEANWTDNDGRGDR